MSTEQTLREALRVHDDHEPIDPDTLDVFVEAARAYADLLEKGQEIEVAEVNEKYDGYPFDLPGPGRYLVVPVEGSEE